MSQLENLVPVFDDEILLDFDPPKEPENKDDKTVETKVEPPKEEFLEIIVNPDDKKVETGEKDTKTIEVTGDNELPTLVYNQFADNGILELQKDKEEYTWDDIQEGIESYKTDLPQQVAESLVKQSPDKGQTLIDYIFTKGAALTNEDLVSFYEDHLSDLSSKETIVDTDDKAKQVITDHLTKQGYRASVVTAMVEASEDEGKLIEDAKKIVGERKSKAQAKLQSAKTEQQADITSQRKFAQDVVSELKNTGWSPRVVNQIRTQLATGKTLELMNHAWNSPKATTKMAALMRHYDPETGDFNFEKFIKQVNTKEVKGLKDKINRDMLSTVSSTKASGGKKKVENKDSFLSSFRPVL